MLILRIRTVRLTLGKAPFLSLRDILPPKGAGTYVPIPQQLAPSGGKWRVSAERGLSSICNEFSPIMKFHSTFLMIIFHLALIQIELNRTLLINNNIDVI